MEVTGGLQALKIKIAQNYGHGAQFFVHIRYFKKPFDLVAISNYTPPGFFESPSIETTIKVSPSYREFKCESGFYRKEECYGIKNDRICWAGRQVLYVRLYGVNG